MITPVWWQIWNHNTTMLVCYILIQYNGIHMFPHCDDAGQLEALNGAHSRELHEWRWSSHNRDVVVVDKINTL